MGSLLSDSSASAELGSKLKMSSGTALGLIEEEVEEVEEEEGGEEKDDPEATLEVLPSTSSVFEEDVKEAARAVADATAAAASAACDGVERRFLEDCRENEEAMEGVVVADDQFTPPLKWSALAGVKGEDSGGATTGCKMFSTARAS